MVQYGLFAPISAVQNADGSFQLFQPTLKQGKYLGREILGIRIRMVLLPKKKKVDQNITLFYEIKDSVFISEL